MLLATLLYLFLWQQTIEFVVDYGKGFKLYGQRIPLSKDFGCRSLVFGWILDKMPFRPISIFWRVKHNGRFFIISIKSEGKKEKYLIGSVYWGNMWPQIHLSFLTCDHLGSHLTSINWLQSTSGATRYILSGSRALLTWKNIEFETGKSF